MPLYDYACQVCDYEEEKLLPRERKDSLYLCPRCSNAMKIKLSSTNFSFKGTGFPTNDMKREK